MNNKKRAIAAREGLASDEEEVEDLCNIPRPNPIVNLK
jgi:hypothetical protein